MALHVRLPSALRGIPARLAAVVLVAGAFGGWAVWPSGTAPSAPPAIALAGKHADRLAFSGDESEIPVREARIYDTIAMFSQPQAEPRPWSAAPVPATVQEAGIRPTQLRSASLPRLVASEVTRKPVEAAKPVRVASADPARPSGRDHETSEPVKVLGWNVPGSQHAARALDKVGSGVAAVGSGTARVVSRSASALGSGVMNAGSALAETLGLN